METTPPRPNLPPIFKPVLPVFLFLLVIGLFAIGINRALGDSTIGVDFFVYWTAGQAVKEGINPYSDEVAVKIQEGIYQRPALPNEDPMPFNYPLYVLLFILPTIWMSFEWAQSFWMAFNIIALLVLVYFGQPKSPKWLIFSIPFLYNFAFGIIVGNLSIFIYAVIIFCCGVLIDRKDEPVWTQIWIGILMALCTVKPQCVWAYLGFFSLYAIKMRKKGFLLSFIASTSVLIIGSFLVLPQWLSEWINKINFYIGHPFYSPSISTVTKLLFPEHLSNLGGYLIILLVGILIIYKLYRWWINKTMSTTLPAWLSLITYLIFPNDNSSQQIILLIPVVLSMAQSNSKRNILVWIIWFTGSYLAFFLSLSGIYPAGVKVVPLLLFCIWLIYHEFTIATQNRLSRA